MARTPKHRHRQLTARIFLFSAKPVVFAGNHRDLPTEIPRRDNAIHAEPRLAAGFLIQRKNPHINRFGDKH
jgi:hypothetical protein